jgi:outer membrane protein assembly factor BamB
MNNSQERPTPRKKTRWSFPIIVLILALAVQLGGAALLVDRDGTLQALVVMGTWMVALTAILIWWLFFSRLPGQVRLAGIAGTAAIITLFSVLFRFDGFTGGFKPHFSFRFSNSNEERAIEYFADSPSTQAGAGGILEISEADWPRFGGNLGDQVARGESIRIDWDTHPPRALWRQPVGAGWSSFAIVGELAFTQEQRGEFECVVCYHALTGEQRWIHQDRERFEESAGGPGPRATPTVHDSKLYTLGATGVLNCLNPLTGEVLWSTNVVKDNGGALIEWAAAGSPVIHDDLVLVNPATSSAFLAAYDRLTGERRWLAKKGQAGYATPVVAPIGGETQVVMYRATGVGGYSIEDGRELWFFEWINNTKINVAQPMLLPDDGLFISTGYGGGSARLALSREGESWSVKSLWERPNRFKLKFNGGIIRDGYVYGLDESVLACFDLEKGERTWKRGRYGYGQILMVEDRLLILTEQGEVALVEVNPQSMKERVRFQAIEGKTWNHPVLNRGLLFVRNDTEAACFDLR